MSVIATVTLPIRLLAQSAMSTLPIGVSINVGSNDYVDSLLFMSWRIPDESSATPLGVFIAANIASPLSPVKVGEPVPAIVNTIPVDIITLRIRLFPVSQMYTLPVNKK